MKPDIERRAFGANIELRAAEDGQKIVGYAAVFNSYSEDLGGFRERIAAGAFANVLENDVRALFNHESDVVLGRTKSGTLTLEEDETGLRVEITPPNTQAARDVMELLKRGDVDQMSFAFRVGKDMWTKNEDETIERTITEIASLYDVSVVTYPAYPDTSAAVRSFEKFKATSAAEQTLPDFGAMRRRLMLIS